MNNFNELALSYLASDEDPHHAFALQFLRHVGAQTLFHKLGSKGIDTSALTGIVARGMLSKARSTTESSYSDRLDSSKSSAVSLIELLREGPLFQSPAEQELAVAILTRLTELPVALPPGSALRRKGKAQESRSLRLSIQLDLRMEGIELSDDEFAELCSFADPEINFETAKREHSPTSQSAAPLLDHNAKLSVIYGMYCKAIA
jgi:hypothetical protein